VTSNAAKLFPSYLLYVKEAMDEAQQRIWTFYEAVKSEFVRNKQLLL